jgi:hypothetical protein
MISCVQDLFGPAFHLNANTEKLSFIQVKDMFYHAFDGYMQYAFPLDELRPLSCRGEDSLGGYALTLVRY